MISGHVFIATSLDRFIARPNGEIDWLLQRDAPDEDHGYNDFMKNIDGIIMGRGTFEKVLTFDPWPYSLPVVVMSKTLKSQDLPSHLAERVRFSELAPPQLMKTLENEGWSHVYVDGGQIIQSFLREKLIADMVITTAPVLLGHGRRLFGDLSHDVSLSHTKTTAFRSGLVQSTYKVNR